MQQPLHIRFNDLPPFPSVENNLRLRISELERLVPDLLCCEVTLESAGNRCHPGHRYIVRIEVRCADGGTLLVEHQAHGDIDIAARRAFDAVLRRLAAAGPRETGLQSARDGDPALPVQRTA